MKPDAVRAPERECYQSDCSSGMNLREGGMQIELSPDTEKLVRERLKEGDYRDASEFVNEAIQLLLRAGESGERQPAAGTGELKALILLEGSLPANWKDTIY